MWRNRASRWSGRVRAARGRRRCRVGEDRRSHRRRRWTAAVPPRLPRAERLRRRRAFVASADSDRHALEIDRSELLVVEVDCIRGEIRLRSISPVSLRRQRVNDPIAPDDELFLLHERIDEKTAPGIRRPELQADVLGVESYEAGRLRAPEADGLLARLLLADVSRGERARHRRKRDFLAAIATAEREPQDVRALEPLARKTFRHSAGCILRFPAGDAEAFG